MLAISTTTAALSPTTFQANDAYVRNAKAYANTSSTAFGEIAHANVNAYAAGGGVDHGDGDVTVSDSVFGGFYYFAGPAYLGNQAYVDQVYAHAGYADGAGHTGYAYANVNATAYGGGIRTGDGYDGGTMSAVAGSLSVTGSTFQANQAFVRQADANAYGYEQANAEVDATAGGGGVDHGNAYYNTVTITGSTFGGYVYAGSGTYRLGNQAYVYNASANADAYGDDGAAYARASARATGH